MLKDVLCAAHEGPRTTVCTKCNYETYTDLFLPLNPSFLPFPLASFTSLLLSALWVSSVLIHNFLRSLHPHLQLLLSTSPSSSYFLEPPSKYIIYMAFVLTTPLAHLLHISTCPGEKNTWACWLLWVLEKQGVNYIHTLFQSYRSL